ncbi:MAG: hypothetical protein U0Y10_07490 [Spirosomataceae bacterium]
MTKPAKYLGYRPIDYETDYAPFFIEAIAPIPKLVAEVIKQGCYPAGQLPSIEHVNQLQEKGYLPIETGYTIEPDGSARVAVLTPMPEVSPLMWDWWFGWHGSHDNRYKLWHPKAHQSAAWQDGRQDVEGYIGRTSLIEEYIGSSLEKAAIRFVPPAELGLDNSRNGGLTNEVFICARLGYSQWPIDFGWLVHQVRATANGAEMRSRFWMGGAHIQIRSNSLVAKGLSKVLQKVVRLPEQQAKDLLAHCSEEMNHLTSILPSLYKSYHPSKA